MKYTAPFIFAITIALTSCVSDNQEDFYESVECDTSDVTFNGTIDAILDRNCKSCHFTGNGTGVTLVSYSDIKTHVDNGSLMGAIKHQPGYSPMPQGGKLDDCTIAKLDAWISDGAPNN
ncbi:hypothetical protein [Saccharicrinis sp. 156]|uniref:hypothetical protein n=1 Tax=Saccharicrinis sp. 156 TaxID=3417574 RepID=UPI003D32D07F